MYPRESRASLQSRFPFSVCLAHCTGREGFAWFTPHDTFSISASCVLKQRLGVSPARPSNANKNGEDPHPSTRAPCAGMGSPDALLSATTWLETARLDLRHSQLLGGHVLILRPHSQDCNRQNKAESSGPGRAQSSHSSPQGPRCLHQGIAPVEDSVAPKCKPSQRGPPRASLDGRFQSHFSRGLVVKDWLHLLVTPVTPFPIPGPIQSWTWPLPPPASSVFQALLLARDGTGSWVTWGVCPPVLKLWPRH